MSLSKQYQVEITETLQKIVDVMADTAEEAISQVSQQYDKGEIVLESSDFVDFTVDIFD